MNTCASRTRLPSTISGFQSATNDSCTLRISVSLDTESTVSASSIRRSTALTRTGHIERARLGDASEIGHESSDLADLAIDGRTRARDHPTGALSMSQQRNLSADHHQRVAEIMCKHRERIAQRRARRLGRGHDCRDGRDGRGVARRALTAYGALRVNTLKNGRSYSARIVSGSSATADLVREHPHVASPNDRLASIVATHAGLF